MKNENNTRVFQGSQETSTILQGEKTKKNKAISIGAVFSKCLALLLLGAISLSASAAPVFAATDVIGAALYVSPAGNDAATGDIDAPLATPDGAKAYLQAHKSDYPDGATVYFREGVYTLFEAVSFTEKDLPNVTFCAYGNEDVTFTAAAPLSGFSETTVNGVKAYSMKTDRRFNALYHPERAIATPRYPASGSFTVKGVERADELFPDNKGWWDASNGCTAFIADREEVRVDFSQPEAVYCRITHAWLDEIARIRFYDEADGKVGLGRPATYEVKPGDVYWFENVFEALDAPGEWYLDERGGILYYIPFDGETAKDLTLYAPVSPYLLAIDGCGGLTFDHIRFTGSEWTLAAPPEDGGTRKEYDIDAYQASTDCDAAVNIQNADGIVFRNCEFTDIGNTALRFIKNCHACAVKNCLFRHIGSTAIAVYGENTAPDAANAAEAMSGFTITNNLIEAYGRNTYESTGVHLMYVKDSEARHNEIHDGYYTGLSCGWIWGHEYQVTENIQITDNLIYDIGQGWLSDLGGMYLLGEQRGTRIARNVICNVTRGTGANDYGGNGIYTDAGSSYFTIENNLIYDCAANGINIGGYNKDHTVRGNIVAFCKLSAFDPGWGDGLEDDHTCDCTGNVFYADDAPVILDLSETATFTESNNLLWDRSEGEKIFGSDGYSGNYEKKTKLSAADARRNGFLLADVIADPLFEDPENRDFTLRADSPAFSEIGFTAVDFNLAGIAAGETVGCGGEWRRGATARVNDLSAYPNACAEAKISYGAKRLLRRSCMTAAAALLFAAAVTNVLIIRINRGLPARRRLQLLLCAPLALILLAPGYYFFAVNWQMVPYGVCLGASTLCAGAALWLALRRLPVRLAAIVCAAAASMCATFYINNILHYDVALAFGVGALIQSAVVFACALALRRQSLKEPRQDR